MSDNHDLLNDKDVCSFEEHEAENVCSNKDAVACGDGCLAFEETLILCRLEDCFERYVPVFLAGKNVYRI